MEKPHLVVGLGNPGKGYLRTRHNAGYMVVEKMSAQLGAQWTAESRFEALVSKTEAFGNRLFLCRPTTYMNESGRAVSRILGYLKIPVEQMLVIVDDADLTLGSLRMRPGGSSGGHHGLESVERHLGSPDYARLRLGIGRQNSGLRQITGHVLGEFAKAELPVLEKVLERACDQINCWLKDGLERAMNKFNGAVDLTTH